MLPLLPVILILVIASSNIFKPFFSRKLVHIGCGLVLASINYPHGSTKYAVIFIAVAAIIVSVLKPFKFGQKNDIGIISYNLVILAFVLAKQPIRILLPMFIVDPVAGIIGKTVKSPRWCHTKTVAGTAAAAISAYITLYYVRIQSHRILLSIILALIEGGLKYYDNIGITSVIAGYYFLSQKMNWVTITH
ncbi:uncharacterized protein BEWA_012230 [Theileria equi strain WA]|uniref:Membrane protein, putative n=1 Tax=Theileria equi strain WA TaxID=1537102 RepID=L1LBL7_THEEQ|nr:uncharacterized protein BEWA_012230 [Theileria equi strain WA]EKX72664.1 membrane protein, putative [Theileria equi strain WA]|eukprot:XP_004832116.1 uncharacterized protein BEWA_012230 [Theileria equi strain WA]